MDELDLLKKDNILYYFNMQTGNSKLIDIVKKSFKSFFLQRTNFVYFYRQRNQPL